MVTEHVQIDCRFEADCYKQRRLKGSINVHLRESHRKECGAHMPIKCITVFPEYPVPSYVASTVSKQNLHMYIPNTVGNVSFAMACIVKINGLCRPKENDIFIVNS